MTGVKNTGEKENEKEQKAERRKAQNREYARKRYYKDVEESRKKHRDWRRKKRAATEFLEREKVAAKQYYDKRKTDRSWLDRRNAVARARARRLKEAIIAAYGGKCDCCGESRPEFLAVDHVNGGGNKHRKELRKRGCHFYEWLRMNNFPKDGFRLLCFNCNHSLGAFGYCPHQRERELS